MSVHLSAWLDLVQREYLAEYIREGGAAVKFVVASDHSGRKSAGAALRDLAVRGGYQFAAVDAAETRVHLIERVFHEVARQTDWAALASSFVTRVVSSGGLTLPEDPLEATLEAIAALNGLPEARVGVMIEKLLWDALWRDYAMSQEFRLAMVRLCRAQLAPDDEPTVSEAVRLWLRGELRRISELKRALIFQKIGRHNGRHMLFSLAHWLRLCGKSGLVLVLDIARCALVVSRAERDESVFYSTPATLDAYEVLRQLVDGVDELEGGLVAVLTGADFLSDDRRGVRRYNALYLRVADDVRDEHHENPLAALVRVAQDGAVRPAVERSAG